MIYVVLYTRTCLFPTAAAAVSYSLIVIAADGVLGYSSALLRNNTGPDYANGESLFSVFGVFFPTACGVLSGINMSGDLRNPRKAIAQGTIAATALRFAMAVVINLSTHCVLTWTNTVCVLMAVSCYY